MVKILAALKIVKADPDAITLVFVALLAAAPVALDGVSSALPSGFAAAVRQPIAAGFLARLKLVKLGEPDWTLVDLPGVANLRAVKWRQMNLARAPDRADQLHRLRLVLFGGN